MRVVVLPGMDGGAELSAEFRACFDDAVGVAYPPDVALGYAELEDLVRSELAMSSEPTVLVAESFSGPIAIRIGAAPPDILAGVLLIATFVRPPAPAFLRHFVGSYLFSRAPPASMVRRAMLDADADDAAVAAVRAAIERTRPEVLAARARAILSVDVRDELRRIDLPLRYLEARHDRKAHMGRALLGVRPDLDIRVIDAPHLVLKSRPRAAAKELRDFISVITG